MYCIVCELPRALSRELAVGAGAPRLDAPCSRCGDNQDSRMVAYSGTIPRIEKRLLENYPLLTP